MAASKKVYSFENKVFMHYDNDEYTIEFGKTKQTTTNPKRAVAMFSEAVKRYLEAKVGVYLVEEGRNTETGCKCHMSCEMCLMEKKFEKQDCYKENPERFYEMFNKPACDDDSEKKVEEDKNANSS